MTEAEFLDIVARDQAARAMLAALEATNMTVLCHLGEDNDTSRMIRAAIAAAKAAGIKAEG